MGLFSTNKIREIYFFYIYQDHQECTVMLLSYYQKLFHIRKCVFFLFFGSISNHKYYVQKSINFVEIFHKKKEEDLIIKNDKN